MADKPRLLEIKTYGDDRGFVYCALDRMHELGIKRTYVVENFARGQVRAWHGHEKSDTYIHCIKGAAKIGVVPLDEKGMSTFVISDKLPGIVCIPAGHYNGAMSLENNTKLIIFSTSTFQEVVSDDIRAPWNAFGVGCWEVVNR